MSRVIQKTPNIVLVGQPNVGKSTLFNAFARRRISIIDVTPGTTRDRVSSFITHHNLMMELVDTGGLDYSLPKTSGGRENESDIFQLVRQQIETAIKQSDIILFMVDIRTGLNPVDKDIANLLRRQGKPIILVANKADTSKYESGKEEFFGLGLDEPLAVSAIHRRGLDSLLDKITSVIQGLKIEPLEISPEKGRPLKLAIVGKRNVGKSTLVNTMAREERVIVSETPGTTRDSVDVRFELEGNSFIAIDTAGLRKKSKLKDSVEFYSRVRTEGAIKRADVVLFLIEAQEKISEIDKKIANFIESSGKPCILVLNKWDLVEKKVKPNDYVEYINQSLPDLIFAPIAAISARNGFNVWETIKIAQELFKQASVRVSTSVVNKALQAIKTRLSPPSPRGRSGRLYYASQIGTQPPTIVVVVNDPEIFPTSYQRYLVRQFREELPFSEVPLRLELKEKRGKRQEHRAKRQEHRAKR